MADSYYVYILRCADGSLYTGITTDLSRRLNEHISQGSRCAKYTKTHRVLRVEAAWSAPDRASASRLEYRVKALGKPEKERLIAGSLPGGPDMSEYERITE